MSAIKINDSTVILLVVLLLWIFFFGCATAPTSAPVMEISGDAEFARLLESIRVKGDLPAVFGSVIINGEIYLTAAVGTRKIGTENWVTADDKFLIGSCGKAFSATLAGILVEEGLLKWHTTLKDVFPAIIMLPEYELITLEQLLSHRAGLHKNFMADLEENRPTTPESGRLQYVEQIVKTNMYVDPTNRRNIISRITKKKLHTPPNAVPWKYDDQYFKTWEKLIGWPLTSANYALGWYDLKTKDGEKVLYHGSATKSFIADVYVSPNYGSGILLATNERTSHIPLYEGAKRINAQYSLKITLP